MMQEAMCREARGGVSWCGRRRCRVCGRAVNGHRLTWGDYDRIIYLLIPLMYSCKILFYYIYNKVLYISWVIEGKGGITR